MLQWIAGQHVRHGLSEVFFQRQIDPAHRAMEVNCAEQVGSRFDKVNQRRQPARVNGQARRSEERVVQQPIDIERSCAVAGHVGVAKHEVHVVYGVDSAEERSQFQ